VLGDDLGEPTRHRDHIRVAISAFLFSHDEA
jgi:hypothetical protein